MVHRVNKLGETRRGRAATWGGALSLVALAAAGCGALESSESSAEANADGVAAAQQVVDEISVRPTEIAVDVPIEGEIPEGKTIAYVHCGVAACNPWAEATEEAAEVLDWTAKIYYTKGTPEGVQAAWNQVVRDKPDGVLSTGWDKAAFSSQLEELEAAGIPVVNATVSDSPGDGIELVVNGPEDFGEIGRYMAARAVAATEGKTNTLYVNAPDYLILKPALARFKEAYEEFCADCALDVMDMPVTAVGNDSVNRIVSHLRSHPQVTAVVNSISGLTLGLPAALKSAGLEDVKIIDNAPTPENMAYIRGGSQDSTAYADARESAWMLVDALARIFTGEPVVTGKAPAVWLLTKENIPDGDFTNVENYQEQFEKLWNK